MPPSSSLPIQGIPFPAFDPVAIHIGMFSVRWYALAYVAGLVLGWMYGGWLIRRFQNQYPFRITSEQWENFFTLAILGVILGGRFGYVVFYNLDYYLENPSDILAVWQGGMAFHGGLIGVILAITFFSLQKKLSLLTLSDLVVASAPIGLFFGRLANFINGELHGRITTVPWGIIFPDGGNLPRHPSQLYQAGLEGLVLFLILFMAVHFRWTRAQSGRLTALFLILYGLFRIIGETVREPDPQLGFLLGGITMGQVLSVPMILAGLGLLVLCHLRSKKALLNTEPLIS